jgi:hypothetical protein
LLGHWGLTVAGLPSSDSASPNGLAGLLGQEDEVPADSASRTDLLLTDCSGDSDADAEEIAFETAAAEVDAGSA